MLLAPVGSGRARLLAVLAAALPLAGTSCSSKKEDAKPVYPVRGQVLHHTKPAVGAFVLFVPVNEPAEPKDPRPRAEVDKEGNFTISTYAPNDGAPAGDYHVLIRWHGHTPDGLEVREDRLRGRYSDPAQPKSRVTVKAEPNELPPFHVQ